MLQIYCPHCCELREEAEFSYAGEADITRPIEPEKLTDIQWGDYVFFRKNTKGKHYELWYHLTGCRRYIRVCRDTVSYDIEQPTSINPEQP